MINKPIQFVFAINKHQYQFNEHTEHLYIPYITAKWLSIYPDCLFHTNAVNLYPSLDRKLHHDYLFYSISKKSRFIKWETDKPQVSAAITAIVRLYKYTVPKAREIAKLLSADQVKILEQQLKQLQGNEQNDRHSD